MSGPIPAGGSRLSESVREQRTDLSRHSRNAKGWDAGTERAHGEIRVMSERGSSVVSPESPTDFEAVFDLDLTGLKCPLPALRTRKALRALGENAVLRVTATDQLAAIDIPNVVREESARIESQSWDGFAFSFLIRRA